MVVDTIEEGFVRIVSVSLDGDDKHRTCAVIGITVALLAQLNEMLVVSGEGGQFDVFEDNGTSGIVQHGVIGHLLRKSSAQSIPLLSGES